jgi:AcrR family transcriptional regulator
MAAARRGPRERMIYSTAQLMRREGVSSTGVRDVVAHANAPRGSVRHYFPDGKEQLVNEAVAWAGNFAASRVERLVAGMSRPTPSKLFAAMVQQWIDEYRTQGFGAGCPLAAATIDCAQTTESIRAATSQAFSTWRGPLAQALIHMGVPARKAGSLATLMISTLEGALILARAERDLRPLTTVVRELGPLLDSQARSRQG